MDMDTVFSPFVIEALTQVISGGPGMSNKEPPIGVYRTGGQIESFLLGCGIRHEQGTASRVPALRASLTRAAEQNDGDKLIKCAIERVADPRDFPNDPEKAEAVRSYLDRRLEADGFELAFLGGKAVLRPKGNAGAAVQAVAERAQLLDFDTVSRDIDRAIKNAGTDPEDTVTAACSTLESVCRSILIELGLSLPTKKDISGLIKAVQRPLGLSPGRTDLSADIADDVRQVLSGLTTAAQGIGALRTHGGDAHGRERGWRAVDAHIARLAIHTASTIALFLIETWEHKQRRSLPNREFPQ